MNKNIIIDSLDQPNATPDSVKAMPTQDYKVARPLRRTSGPGFVWFQLVVGVGVAIGLTWGLVRLVGYVSDVNAGDYGQGLDWWLVQLVKLALVLGMVSGVVLAVFWGLTRVLSGHLVQLQNGQPVAMLDILLGWRRANATQVALWGLDQFHRERTVWAEHSTFRALGNWSPTNGPQTIPGQPQGLLVDQGPDIGPLPLDRWLAWVDLQPHTMLASKTGRGKSTTVKAILRRRIEAGHQVFVIDPHFQAGHWFDLPAVGGGENWNEVGQAMDRVLEEYAVRMADYHRGQKDFHRLTVLVDEAFLTKFHFDQLYGPKSADHPFRRFTAVLGSGARKVSMSVILITQSPNVEDLGLSGPLRENFSRLALDHRTIRLMVDQDEADPARRKALAERLGTLGDFPATAEIDGRVYFLDRSGLAVVDGPRNSRDAAWTGWNYRPDLLEDLLSTMGTGSTVPLQSTTEANRNGHSGELVPAVDPVDSLEDLAQLARDAGLNLATREDLVRFLVAMGLTGNQVEKLVAGKRAELLRTVAAYSTK